MNLKPLLFIITIYITLLSCSTKKTGLEFEQNVLYEIFPALIDSLHRDLRHTVPPPPIPLYDINDNYIGYDTILSKKIMADWEIKKAELMADSVKLVIAVNDSTYPLKDIEASKLKAHFENKYLIPDSIDLSKGYKIDLNRLKANPKLKFKYRSSFPNGSDMWKKKYSFYLSGTTGFSRIRFDQSKTYGVLNSGYGCGKLCGWGTQIFIKKINGKWTIDKIVGTWIS